MWSVYCLETISGPSKTYVGASLDVDRRLKQHNGILSGGAKATHGLTWTRVCHVTGFPHERAALQFEWKWKHVSKQVHGTPLQRRIKALCQLFGFDSPTRKATDFLEYVDGLEVVWESSQDIYRLL